MPSEFEAATAISNRSNSPSVARSAAGISTAAAVWETSIENGSRFARVRAISSRASRHTPPICVAARYSSVPASVGVTSLLACRTNNGAPTIASSEAMREDTVDCETLSSSAAMVNCPVS